VVSALGAMTYNQSARDAQSEKSVCRIET